MIKTVTKLLFTILLAGAVPALAQVKDTLKTDSVKIDTGLLNRYRIESRRNALPTRIRPVELVPEYIPLNMPEYNISHWKRWFTVALNFNQSAFSTNWSAGGVSAVAVGTNVIMK